MGSNNSARLLTRFQPPAPARIAGILLREHLMTTNITPRAVLAGAPAVAAAAALPATASANPDAELLASIARYPIVNEAYLAALNAEEELRFGIRAALVGGAS